MTHTIKTYYKLLLSNMKYNCLVFVTVQTLPAASYHFWRHKYIKTALYLWSTEFTEVFCQIHDMELMKSEHATKHHKVIVVRAV